MPIQPPFIVSYSITTKCNLKCKHCYSESVNKAAPDELATEEAFGLMDDFSEGGNPLEQGPPDLQTIQNTAKEILNDALLYMAAKRAFVFNGKMVTPRGYKKSVGY